MQQFMLSLNCDIITDSTENLDPVNITEAIVIMGNKFEYYDENTAFIAQVTNHFFKQANTSIYFLFSIYISILPLCKKVSIALKCTFWCVYIKNVL